MSKRKSSSSNLGGLTSGENKDDDLFGDLFKVFDNIKDEFEQKFVKKSEFRNF